MNVRRFKGGAKVKAIFKGPVCIGYDEPDPVPIKDVAVWRMFRRPHYQTDKAPMVEVPYRVVDKPIKWY